MNNIVPFPLSEVFKASNPVNDKNSPLQRMEHVRAEMQAVFVGLTAIQHRLANCRNSAASQSEAETVHKRGGQN